MTKLAVPLRKRIFVVLSAVLACWSGRALAQDAGGPIVIGQQKRIPFTQFIDPHAALDFKYRWESDQSNFTHGENQKFTENRFEETFTIDGQSYLYHPNLVALSLSGTFGLSQEFDTTDGKTENQPGTIYDHDIEATILRKAMAPLTLYSRRTHDVVQRELGPSLDTTNSQYGAIWDIRSKSIPTRIEVYHRDEDQTGLGELDNFNLSQNVLTYHSDARPTPFQVVNIDYTLTDEHQTSGLVSSSFVTHDLNASHSWDFGRDRKNNLTSTLSYFSETGDFNLERLRVDELMRLQHSEEFQTNYEYTLDQQSFDTTDQTQNIGRAGFIWRLYKSLVTTGNVGVKELTQSQGGDTSEYYGNLNWDYTKRVPFGTFHGGLGLGYDHQEVDAHGVTSVIDSVGTFTDPQPIIIAAPNVVPGSLIITDPSGLLLYQPGLDYTVQQFGTRTEVDRIVGGRISNGDTVLVDYQLEPEPASVSDTTTFSISARYDITQSFLRGVSIYGGYTRQNQDLSTSETSTLIPDSFTDELFGAEYRIWELDFGAEHEMHDSTVSPFNASRFYGRWTHPMGGRSSITAITNYTIIDYNDINNEDRLLTISATYTRQFTNELHGYVTVLYRDEHDDTRGALTGIEEQSELRWKHRQTDMYIRQRYSQLNTRDEDQTFQFVEVGIRREF